MENKKINIDDLIKKIPNKYELAIACGKAAREKFVAGTPKHKVMDIVFQEIIDDEITIEEV
ncbi:DNA-directed RNA polymerase subunit omega [Caviibacter abscessus]|uniref:DNA-directed RNA polymerase subunit omega n=1 Tax=Caviibacter abscessus TaxID=1766719 RepID=UPI00082F1ECC|nr:DNA-directed RNA polymerase subunit omega [Caviibacter abscessus]